ncbi:hypothetical protein [Mycobacteroides abscessus]|uniref:hypothetical protein n=1 Tax=Mycobacteroides abscessus TaxID=36809 RepID=UPI000C268DF1|nr:hypothetical protein [Mycobacteroides abscessus]RIS59132.1 hypothetical protein D2E46_07245 [Mycobacteroides abscessus]
MKQIPANHLMVYCDASSHSASQLGPLMYADADVVVPDGVWVWPFTRVDGKQWFDANQWQAGNTLDEQDGNDLRGSQRLRRVGGMQRLAPADGAVLPWNTRDKAKFLSAIKKARADAGLADGEGLSLGTRFEFRCPRCGLDPRLNAKGVEAVFHQLVDSGIVGVSVPMLEGMVKRTSAH